MHSAEIETLRWPTNLDHDAIVRRLVGFREAAESCGLRDLSAYFADVENMPAAQIAVHVVGTLTWLLERAEYRPLAKRLEMVAMNLKNLRSDLQTAH
jgi:hypothetical protein